MILITEVETQNRRGRESYVGTKTESRKEKAEPWHEQVQVLMRSLDFRGLEAMHFLSSYLIS